MPKTTAERLDELENAVARLEDEIERTRRSISAPATPSRPDFVTRERKRIEERKSRRGARRF